MYRPTVRYSGVYKDYIDSLFRATHLDRNQIIRAALFAAAHSPEFLRLMNENKKGDAPLPLPKWQLSDSQLWMEREPKKEKRREDVKDALDRGAGKAESISDIVRGADDRKTETRRQQPEQGRIRQVRTREGGLRISIS